ncbi:MAG: hypothetical protein IJ651_01945 [Bacteroidales bacterium]|nr:hypothetical protein [Bacteroidales bacterium]
MERFGVTPGLKMYARPQPDVVLQLFPSPLLLGETGVSSQKQDATKD